jgi:tetratricopeptide (TPR) repeat protein
VQDEIAQAVAAALRGALAGRTPTPPQQQAAPRGPANIEAYELYLKGRLSLERQTEGVARAREYLEQALRLDSGFAPAHAGIARVHSQLGAFAIRPAGEAFPAARAAAERALALDDALPEAHAILGMTLAVHEWDWARGERHLARSIALDPGLSLPRQYRALTFAVWRRLDEAVAEAERAVRNDPLALSAHHALVTYLTLARRYGEAIAAAQRAFDLNPRPVTILMFYGLALAGDGRLDESIALLEELTALPLPSSLPPYLLAAAYMTAGREADLRRLRDELVDRATRTWVSPFALSVAHWCLGEHGDAEGWLRRALRERDFLPSWSHAVAPLDEYRADPRIAPLLAQVGPRSG